MVSEYATAVQRPSYFLVSVSTRENLELCLKHGLAGFPSGEGGAWTFCEIREGDFISFLYGARARNLYRVEKREALKNAEQLPPWKLLTFRETGRTYSFPYRLRLQLQRTFDEPLVRAEFSYVAENLLLRGGYSKTHFQADQTTLQNVSEMGSPDNAAPVSLPLPAPSEFSLRFSRDKARLMTPEVMRFKEIILQSAIRRHLMDDNNLQSLLQALDLSNVKPEELEVLGEKALPEGHIDLLLKRRVPLGSTLKVPVEVKSNKALPKDLIQLRSYLDELVAEAPAGVLIARDFHKTVVNGSAHNRVRLVRYRVDADLMQAITFEDIYLGIKLEPLN